MKIKVNEASGAVLDWMVAKCEGKENTWGKSSLKPYPIIKGFSYSSDWAQGGPIIEREKIATNFSVKRNCWFAESFMETDAESGTTLLEAAMRCYVASKLGEEVEVPDEIV